MTTGYGLQINFHVAVLMFNVWLQVLVVADKVVFCNCLVAMRLKAGQQDIPSTHNVATYIHNEFVKWLRQLKGEIQVS